MVTYFIDGIEVKAQKSETILQVARRYGIYIPTMCYLTKTKPIASCRLCVVEIEGSSGFVLSCQTPAVNGTKVITNSIELKRHRTNIMKLYNVNHPLECGVCDKSGYCDLQNKTLEFELSSQEFSAKEQKRDIKKYQFLNYDPNLCILCEKCVHTCNEIIGDDAITISYGGYKSAIVPKNSDELDCTNCGECISVCPVGALVSSDFQYKSNAWELNKIPASCSHCSSLCAINYDVKTITQNGKSLKKIFRVTNEYEYNSICGAGRFGFDFENRAGYKEEDLKKVISEFQKADTIKFSSYITNEEALILQNLKKLYGYRLINSEAKRYQEFLNNYSKISGKSLYSASLDDIKESDFIIVVGSMIKSDNPVARYALTVASKQKRAEIIYMHPIDDELLKNVYTKHIKYEVGTEEGVVAMVANSFIGSVDSEAIKKYLSGLDIGYISAESNVGEEEILDLVKRFKRKKKPTIIIGEDIISHKRANNIAKLVALLERYANFKTLIVPPKTNSLGVALICDLDNECGNYTIGYNSDGNFTLSSLGDGDFNIPALNQQEGTFVNINKRVVPTNVAISHNGYSLNDIANLLGLDKKYTIDYTKELPLAKGFKSEEFDNLKNRIDSLVDERGYELSSLTIELEDILEEIEDLPTFNGLVVYNSNPILQFNSFTNKTKQLNAKPILEGSKQFAIGAKIGDGDKVELLIDGRLFKRVFKIDTKLKGMIGINPTFDMSLSDDLVSSTYKYKQVKIQKVVEGNE